MTATRASPDSAEASFENRELRFAMRSDTGRVRRGNEDFCAALPECGAFLVCDGMGGAAAGEIASRVAAETFMESVQAGRRSNDVASLLHEAVAAANQAVRRRARMEPDMRGMGTTLVALLLQTPNNHRERSLWLAHVGDSRCYRLRAGHFEPLTRDHSLVEEQIIAGQITPEQAERSPIRNVITRAIGSASHVKAELRRLAPEPGDIYLLASDGLTRELPDAALAKLLDRAGVAEGDLEQVCAALVDAANQAGGRDNITVLLLRIAS